MPEEHSAQPAVTREHALTLENRARQGIQVSELSVRTGQVQISGKIEFLQYAENRQSGGGLLARLLH